MSEADAIANSAVPATVGSLVSDLRALGVADGMTLMVHSSLSSIGFVAGGAHAVVLALLEAVGPEGTLMMPTHSSDVSDPAEWGNPPIPEAWWDTVRANMPVYDPELTPTREMGAIVECFRNVPGVRRSAHPTVSAAAVGSASDQLVGGHGLDDGLGESSPQARLYELDGSILLLGVTHAHNTSLHLSEYRVATADSPRMIEHAPLLVEGERVWRGFGSLETDEDDFEVLGQAFAESGGERQGSVGGGVGRLMRARDVVDFGVGWMGQHR